LTAGEVEGGQEPRQLAGDGDGAHVLAHTPPRPDAVARALGVQPAVLDFRERIAHELPTIDSDLPEKLGELALALSHANTLYRVV